jgi:thioredoxin reductase (NADPH)
MADRAIANPKIKFQWNSKVAEIKGENKLESVTLEDTQTGKQSSLALDGLFVAIGHKPSSELFEGQLNLDSAGYVITNGVATSIPGIYACGDVQDKQYRQAITSAGTGCMAALDAQKFLEEHEATVQVAAAVA